MPNVQELSTEWLLVGPLAYLVRLWQCRQPVAKLYCRQHQTDKCWTSFSLMVISMWARGSLHANHDCPSQTDWVTSTSSLRQSTADLDLRLCDGCLWSPGGLALTHAGHYQRAAFELFVCVMRTTCRLSLGWLRCQGLMWEPSGPANELHRSEHGLLGLPALKTLPAFHQLPTLQLGAHIVRLWAPAKRLAERA